MLINFNLLLGEIHTASLHALSLAAIDHNVTEEQLNELEKTCKTLKNFLVELEQLPDLVVEVQGDEYFTFDLP